MTKKTATKERRGGELGKRKPASRKRGKKTWDLRLYVVGSALKSRTALANLERLCEEHIPGRYRIEVVDLLENPALARADQILAIPTLVRKLPIPVKRLIGDLSDSEKAMVALDLGP